MAFIIVDSCHTMVICSPTFRKKIVNFWPDSPEIICGRSFSRKPNSATLPAANRRTYLRRGARSPSEKFGKIWEDLGQLSNFSLKKSFLPNMKKNVMGHKKNSCITKKNVITYKKVGGVGCPACWWLSCESIFTGGFLVFGNL
jgi:hypothetical protein